MAKSEADIIAGVREYELITRGTIESGNTLLRMLPAPESPEMRDARIVLETLARVVDDLKILLGGGELDLHAAEFEVPSG